MSGLTLSDLTGLSEPATALINRVSDAVGGIAKPGQIRRVAQAEAEAAKIAAHNRVEISEIEERGLLRMIREEGRNQENIESIAAKAIPHLEEGSKPEELEKDFIRYMFDKARLVSDDEMQELWAKILAGEANNKGAFSKRTMEVISKLEKKEARLFTNLCRHCWNGSKKLLIVNKYNGPYYQHSQFEWPLLELQQLEHAGLIQTTPVGLVLTHLRRISKITYWSVDVILEFVNEENNSLKIGNVNLTSAGKELFDISGVKPSKTIFEQTLLEFQGNGAKTTIQLDTRGNLAGFSE